MRKYDYVFLCLSGFFLASLVLANALVFKFVDVPIPFLGVATISVGVLPYPITFLCTDLISELYGKKRADALVVVGFLVSAYMLVLLKLAGALPVSAAQQPEIQDHYMAIFGQSTRAIVASMIAYLTAQLVDVRLYHFWRRLTDGRHLWLRNNASTMLSQLIDTTAVVLVLFYGVWGWGQISAVIVASYSFKLIVAAVDTPLMYAGTWIFADIKDESRGSGLIEESA